MLVPGSRDKTVFTTHCLISVTCGVTPTPTGCIAVCLFLNDHEQNDKHSKSNLDLSVADFHTVTYVFIDYFSVAGEFQERNIKCLSPVLIIGSFI